ncbi:hypothetical protein H2203_002929 [Taxawa tesnikishii (nom. ined.)]|nr:hypothetical protein H2203_002929 [Dothideales sp. JES 119]
MATPTKQHIAVTLLSRAHSPDTSNSIFRDRVKQKPLLLRATSPDPSTDARAQRQKARLQKAAARRRSNKTRPLSAKQKRALCIYDIPKEQQKHAIYEPLHGMWCNYIREVLGHAGAYVAAQSHGPMLLSADYHGAKVEVVRSRCVDRVGLRGIVVKDTKFTFEIVTEANELKTLPKEHTVFRFKVPHAGKEITDGSAARPLVFEIHGSQLEHRAPDRANRKFKLHIDPDL